MAGIGEKARDKVFNWFAGALHRLGVRPNHLTLGQIPIYALMVKSGFEGDLWAFGWYQVAIMVLDGMDGTLARRMGTASRSGAYLDAAFDIVGIILVVVVASHLYPSYAVWIWAALAANLALYAQNWHLDEKAVSYVRGPLVLAMYFEVMFPGIFWFGVMVPLVVSTIIVLTRLVRSPEPSPKPGTITGPPAYRPGFSSPRKRA